MPHMSNLPWVEMYLVTMVMVIALSCQLVHMNVSPSPSHKMVHKANNLWKW